MLEMCVCKYVTGSDRLVSLESENILIRTVKNAAVLAIRLKKKHG